MVKHNIYLKDGSRVFVQNEDGQLRYYLYAPDYGELAAVFYSRHFLQFTLTNSLGVSYFDGEFWTALREAEQSAGGTK